MLTATPEGVARKKKIITVSISSTGRKELISLVQSFQQ